MPLRNVLVFALGGSRFAVELRWVREVVGIGSLTPVPSAPPAVPAVMNFRGAIVPLITAPVSVRPHPAPDRARAPRAGDQAILLDVDGTRAAIAADRIDEVTTLIEAPEQAAAGMNGLDAMVDPKGKLIPLIDPATIFAEVRDLVAHAATRLAERLAGDRGGPGASGGG